MNNDSRVALDSAVMDQTSADHLAFLNEVSALVLSEASSEHVFAAVAEVIHKFYGTCAVAIYGGEPLTLRLQVGGVPIPVGTPVPEGLAHRALLGQQPLISAALDQAGAAPRMPWAPKGTRSEAVFPLLFQGRRVGVLALFCPRDAPLDQAAMASLSVVARLLVVSAVQEQRSMEARSSQNLQNAYDKLQGFAEFKDQILQNISHELRTPLTLVKGYLELVRTGQMGDLSQEQDQALHMIVQKVDEIVIIINRAIALSPMGSFSLDHKRIVVAELLDEVLALFGSRAAEAGVVLLSKPVESDLCLLGDRDQIRQVCYNILDNSVKFSPNGGRVSIEARRDDVYVHLVFEDEGIGIPKRQLTQIFDTFYQVDGSTTRRFGGLGLGLAVVNRVVRAHKGKVWAESEVDRGTTFHVLLPQYMDRPRFLSIG